MLPVVSSTVFLSARLFLIAIKLGLSFQLFSRGFSFRHGGRADDRWKREKGGEEGRRRGKEGEEGRRSGRARVADQLQAWRNGLLELCPPNWISLNLLCGSWLAVRTGLRPLPAFAVGPTA